MNFLVFILLSIFSINDYTETLNNDSPPSQQIHVKGSLDQAPYTLINKDGTLIMQGLLVSNSIDVSALNKGLYYVKTTSVRNQPMSYSFAK